MGVWVMVLFSKLLEMENSCWGHFFLSLLLNISFFAVDENKRSYKMRMMS